MPNERSIVLAVLFCLAATPLAAAGPLDEIYVDVTVDPPVSVPEKVEYVVLGHVERTRAQANDTLAWLAQTEPFATVFEVAVDVQDQVDDLVEVRDTDCRGAYTEQTYNGTVVHTDFERCTPVIHHDPGPTPLCKPEEGQKDECCHDIRASCAAPLMVGFNPEVGGGGPLPFCIRLSWDGIQPTISPQVGASCYGPRQG